MARHPHHDSQEWRDREHAGWVSEQRKFGTYAKVENDTLRQLAMEREEKERRKKPPEQKPE